MKSVGLSQAVPDLGPGLLEHADDRGEVLGPVRKTTAVDDREALLLEYRQLDVVHGVAVGVVGIQQGQDLVGRHLVKQVDHDVEAVLGTKEDVIGPLEHSVQVASGPRLHVALPRGVAGDARRPEGLGLTGHRNDVVGRGGDE